MAMFVNTCGGDQNPLPRRSVELCQKYGHMLAAAVEDALKRPLTPVSRRHCGPRSNMSTCRI